MSMEQGTPTYLFVLPWGIEHIGGVNQVVTNLYDEFDGSGVVKPAVLRICWEARSGRQLAGASRRIYEWRCRTPWAAKAPVASLLLYVLLLPYELATKARFLRRERVHVINAHYPSYGVFTLALLRRLGLFRGRLIMSLHGRDFREARKRRPWPRFLWRSMLRWSDVVVTCSEAFLEEVLESGWVEQERATVIHNGVDVERLQRTRDEGRVPADLAARRYVANVATFEHKKGQDILLRAFAGLARRIESLDLVLAGRAGETLDATHRLVEELGLQDRVHVFRDVPHPTVLAIIEGCEAFVLPSRSEAFAVVLLEAAVFAKPVVAADVCGVSELIEDRVDGRLVPADDAGALEAAIAETLGDPIRAQGHGATLCRKVGRQFRWHEAMRRYLEVGGLAGNRIQLPPGHGAL
jgi:glycosyltransferase involved in cell wall biosynthesis